MISIVVTEPKKLLNFFKNLKNSSSSVPFLNAIKLHVTILHDLFCRRMIGDIQKKKKTKRIITGEYGFAGKFFLGIKGRKFRKSGRRKRRRRRRKKK